MNIKLIFTILSLTPSVFAGQSFLDVAGPPPSCASLDIRRWVNSLLDLRLQQNPVGRTNEYYFSVLTGSDYSGDGTEAKPWHSLQKAQFVINSATNGNICLRFRRGEVWRSVTGEGVVALEANIAETYGNSVRLDPKPDWKVMSDWQFELRGGPETELLHTVNINAYDPVTGWLTFQQAPKPQHTSIHAECVLLIDRPNVTITSYGSPVGCDLPRFTRFIYTGPNWQTAKDRGDNYTNVYSWNESIPASGDVAWVFLGSPLKQLYKSVEGYSEVNDHPMMWCWDSAKRTIGAQYELGTPVNNSMLAGEYVMHNPWSGIIVDDVDGVRVDGVRIDGWGACSYPAGNDIQQGYGGYSIVGYCTGTNTLAVTGCEAYYNNRHNIGNVSRQNKSGGILVAKDCSVGLCMEGSCFVSYAPLGQNECVIAGSKGVSSRLLWGAKPYSYDRAINGVFHGAHTSGGTNVIGLFVSYGNEIVTGREMMGLGFPANTPAWSRSEDCRVFYVEDTFRARNPTSLDEQKPFKDASTIGLCTPDAIDNGIHINCWYEHRILWSSGTQNAPTIYGPLPEVRLINCVMILDGIGFDYWSGKRYTCWGFDQIQAFNTQFHIKEYSPAANVGFSVIGCYSPNVVSNILMNSIISAEGIPFNGTSYTEGGLYVGNANDAHHLANNAYCPGDHKTGPGGFSNDPWAVELGGWMPGSQPEPTTALCSAGNQLMEGRRLEYDFLWRTRDPFFPAIGPYEPLTSNTLPLEGASSSFKTGYRNGSYYLDLKGNSGHIYEIQTSTDLLNWVDWAIVEGSGSWMRFVDYATPNQKQRFFRILSLTE